MIFSIKYAKIIDKKPFYGIMLLLNFRRVKSRA